MYFYLLTSHTDPSSILISLMVNVVLFRILISIHLLNEHLCFVVLFVINFGIRPLALLAVYSMVRIINVVIKSTVGSFQCGHQV
jgi:hypothetical protein